MQLINFNEFYCFYGPNFEEHLIVQNKSKIIFLGTKTYTVLGRSGDSNVLDWTSAI